VRYGIISDIHSNLAALQRVLTALSDQDIDRYLCLGDIVGYAARPNECCEMIRDLDCLAVVGNHDLAACHAGSERFFTSAARACILWTREVLAKDNRDFLASLPAVLTVDGVELCHGSLADPEAYITTPAAALPSFGLMQQQLCFFGHTHYAEWFVRAQDGKLPVHFSALAGAQAEIAQDTRYMVNPGAVGQPRDGNSQASFAIWDTESRLLQIRRVGYDVETTQRQIIEAGLPESQATRLLLGI